ncbi:hypothetical protein N7501_003154 [Penicillium viridicatum]|nr:hypothetical protein N7501_003154 [Penicillium viridicatum]
MIHVELPWEGALGPQNKTLEPEGNYPTSGGVQVRLPDRPTGELAFGSELDGADGPQVSIYPAGALTDIALAMRMDPQLASLAKDLVIMGGYVDLHLPADYQVRGNLQYKPDWQPKFQVYQNMLACPGIRRVTCVFEVDVKKLKHRIMHSL